jgi:WD40 repeat protein
LALSPTEPLLAVCTDGPQFGYSGSVHLYDYAAGRMVATLTNSGNKMAFSSDGKTLVTGMFDDKIHVWDVASRTKLRTLGPVMGIASLALSPDGRLLATTQFWFPEIRLWDFPSGRISGTLKGHGAVVWSTVFSPEGRVLASGSSDQTIRLWDVKTQTLNNTLIGHESEIWALAFSPQGDRLWSGSKDETLALWPTRLGPREISIPCQHRPLNPPIISPDGRFVAGADPEGCLTLWDLSTGQATRSLSGEQCALWLSADGRTLLTLSTNCALHFWDLQTLSVRSSTPLYTCA